MIGRSNITHTITNTMERINQRSGILFIISLSPWSSFARVSSIFRSPFTISSLFFARVSSIPISPLETTLLSSPLVVFCNDVWGFAISIRSTLLTLGWWSGEEGEGYKVSGDSKAIEESKVTEEVAILWTLHHSFYRKTLLLGCLINSPLNLIEHAQNLTSIAHAHMLNELSNSMDSVDSCG